MATTAEATTYIGSLSGTVTSGKAKFFKSFGWWQDIDLVGNKINIEFSSSVAKNFLDTKTNVFYPRYVVNNVRIILDLPSPLSDFGGLETNDPAWTPAGNASFVGTATKGVFDTSGSLPSGRYDTQSVHFFFENPDPNDGKVIGGGLASAFAYATNTIGPFYHDTSFYENIKFTLTEGNVRQLQKLGLSAADAVPEPATWAMMFIGFGLVGMVSRAKSRPRDEFIA